MVLEPPIVSPSSAERFISIIQSCRKRRNLDSAKQVHAQICKDGLECDRVLGNHIVPMFVECGSLLHAQDVFDRLIHRNVHSWTSLISGYVECGRKQQALDLYGRMLKDCVQPSSHTLVALLKSCNSLQDVRNMYPKIAEQGFETDVFIGSMLVHMYSKYGSFSEAKEAFDQLAEQNVVSWTALISGYVEHGHSQEALSCYKQMQLQGFSPNDVTYISILKAGGSLGDTDTCRHIHEEIVQKGFDTELFIGSTLVDMYAKCGQLLEAQEVFNKLPLKDAVSWNALISGYAEYGPSHRALECFKQMHKEDISLDGITLVCALKACGNMVAVDKGQEVHMEIVMKHLENDIFIGNTLVDMYAKCGFLLEALNIFDSLPVQDVASFNAIIKGCGTNLDGNLAINLFKRMQEKGVEPDAVTFTCLLGACSHADLACEGRDIFTLMTKNYGITPTVDHFTCLVELLARSGNLGEAERILETTSSSPSKDMWISLLSACKICMDVEVGHRCFQQLILLDPGCSTPYMLMANIYTSMGKKDDAYRLEDIREQARAKRKPASALIEVKNKVHEFVVGSEYSQNITGLLETLYLGIREAGSIPDLDLVVK